MTAQEIQERNKEIALMLGYSNPISDKDFYFVERPQKESTVLPNMLELNFENRFHSDWNWLHEAVEFIKKNHRTSFDTEDAKENELFIDEWEFKVKKYYIRIIQWTKDGWRMFDRNNRQLSIFYIIGENCDSEIEAVFKAVSDFAKLYNEKELKN